MPELTGLLDLQALTELFKDPAKNAEAIQALGPGMTAVDAEQKSAPPDLMGQLMGGGMATNATFPASMPSRDLQAPMLGSAEANLTGQAEPEKKDGIPWVDLLRLGSVGLTDIANIVGNPRAPIGGSLYELNKDYLRQSQVEQLKKRHDMFDDVYKQSVALPTEVLTDPKYAGLAAAKQALEKDAADGKIDNEKVVSGFLTEMARAKKDLDDLQMRTATSQALEQEALLTEGRRQRELQERTQLDSIVSNPGTSSPEAVHRAQIRLNQLKAGDMVTRDVAGQERTLSQGDWTKYDLEMEQQRARQQESANELAARERMHKASLAASERLRSATLGARGQQSTARALQSQINASAQQIGKQLGTDPLTGQPANPEILYAAALDRNKNALLNAAEQSGIPLRQIKLPGATGVGPDGRPTLGVAGVGLVFNGRVYDMNNREESHELLSLIYQTLISGGFQDFEE